MILTIPPETVVFRRVIDDAHKSQWHILASTKGNGFTRKSHPDYETWWASSTWIGLCKRREDDRLSGYGFTFDGWVEFSTLGEINKVCLSCWPWGRTLIKKKERK